MARTRDEAVSSSITRATLELLSQRGFAGMSMDAVAEAADVGKPAIYRRFSSKAELVAAVVATQLTELEVPDSGNTQEELWQAMSKGFPKDGQSYVSLIGGLIAESGRHPELIEAFRRHVLLPRRAAVQSLIESGQARGDIRADISAIAALDLLAGPLLARVFAGETTGPAWRRQSFALWWELVKERPDR